MERRSLGRGLLDLLGTPEGGTTVVQVRLDRIRPNPYQPRRTFPAESIEALAASIREHGLLQPLVVAPDGADYVLVAGERRYRAAQQAGLETVPCVVRPPMDPARLALFALVENLQREDLNPIEEAEGYARLQSEHGLTQEAIARAVGKSRARIANLLRLLQLPEPVRAMVATGQLSTGHALALLGIADDPQAIEALAQEAVARGATVRQVEAAVRRRRQRTERGAPHTRRDEAEPSDAAKLVQRIRAAAAATGVRAALERTKTGWRLTVESDQPEALAPWVPKPIDGKEPAGTSI